MMLLWGGGGLLLLGGGGSKTTGGAPVLVFTHCRDKKRDNVGTGSLFLFVPCCCCCCCCCFQGSAHWMNEAWKMFQIKYVWRCVVEATWEDGGKMIFYPWSVLKYWKYWNIIVKSPRHVLTSWLMSVLLICPAAWISQKDVTYRSDHEPFEMQIIGSQSNLWSLTFISSTSSIKSDRQGLIMFSLLDINIRSWVSIITAYPR